ncbi:MAG: MFS transporter [Clostridiales bacterium]|nr:MFS transporter [Clostridiales bacterium]
MENKKKTGGLNLGAKGLVIVILAFISCYLYSALTSDSLNLSIGIFGELGLNTNVLWSLSSIATVLGILGSILFGKLMAMKTASKIWGMSMVGIAVFAFIWSRSSAVAVAGNAKLALIIYVVGYFVCYVLTLVNSMLLSSQVLANWFPTKRGVAVGIATAGFPVSAATTTSFVGVMAAQIGAFYVILAVVALVTGIVILVYSKDFPEEKGAYPDNNKNYDFETARKELKQNLEYAKTSKWTIGKCLRTGRMWILWITVGIGGFLAMGIMSNFFGKFTEQGYEATEIYVMLAIAGVIAIPGSMFIGWLDYKLGTKVTTFLINSLAVVAVAFNLTNVHALHYISLPILALMLGGSSNMMVACTQAIWGRYDFQNAYRVIQPLNAIMTGIGITTVGLIGTNFSYMSAYRTLLVLAVIAVVATIILKVEPIDEDVARVNANLRN